MGFRVSTRLIMVCLGGSTDSTLTPTSTSGQGHLRSSCQPSDPSLSARTTQQIHFAAGTPPHPASSLEHSGPPGRNMWSLMDFQTHMWALLITSMPVAPARCLAPRLHPCSLHHHPRQPCKSPIFIFCTTTHNPLLEQISPERICLTTSNLHNRQKTPSQSSTDYGKVWMR